MKTLTRNMFAETNEDLPIVSGMGRTELTEQQPEYSDDGMDGHYKACNIYIRPTVYGQYRVQVEKGTYWYWYSLQPTLETAQAWAKYISETTAAKVGDYPS